MTRMQRGNYCPAPVVADVMVCIVHVSGRRLLLVDGCFLIAQSPIGSALALLSKNTKKNTKKQAPARKQLPEASCKKILVLNGSM